MLKFFIENLESVPEEMRGAYKEAEGGYQLQVDGLEDTSGLKTKNADLLKETKQAKDEARLLRVANEEAERKRNEENGNFEKLWQEAQERETQASAKLTELIEQNINKDISARASEIALLSDNPAKVGILSNMAKQYIKNTDDGVKLMIDGVEVQAEDIRNKLTTDYPFLVDGSKAAGGGANGSSNGVTGKQVTRAEFDAKEHNERAAFFKDGGKVIE